MVTTANVSTQRDVFISHASEDKDEIARPLADELIRRGLKVWFDEYELVLGDSAAAVGFVNLDAQIL